MTLYQLEPLFYLILANIILHVSRSFVMKYFRARTETKLGVKLELELLDNEASPAIPPWLIEFIYGLRKWRIVDENPSEEVVREVYKNYLLYFIVINSLVAIAVLGAVLYFLQEILARL